MSDWIDVKVKMPKEKITVLVFCPNPPQHNGDIFDAEYEDGEWWGKTGPISDLGDVTHWMPLPDKPNGF